MELKVMGSTMEMLSVTTDWRDSCGMGKRRQ